MNISPVSGATGEPVWRRRSRWILQALLALVFFGAGTAKFLGVPQLVELFEKIGLGQWFRYFTAACEIGGAILLVIPRTWIFGEALLVCVATGALITHLVVIRDNPADAIVLILLLGAIWWLRKPSYPQQRV